MAETNNVNVYEEFDNAFDVAALAADVEEAAKGDGNFEKLDPGEYEVKVTAIELAKSKKGDPMVVVKFKVVEGECKGKSIHMYQVITQGFQIHIVNELLRSLHSGLNVRFSTFRQYNSLLMDIMEVIDGTYEYVLDYGRTKKGDYDTFKIIEVFELD